MIEQEYINLLIKQYWEKPKARAEIAAKVGNYKPLFDLADTLWGYFDVDQAQGVQLDVVGRIVGISRSVDSVIPKIFFGFSDNPNAGTFGQAPFKDKLEPAYTDMQLDDNLYRRFIKAKIAANTCRATLGTDGRFTSLQMAVLIAFDGKAYVQDNYDMTMTLFVSPSVEEAELRAILRLGLVPTPQGVGFDIVIRNEPGNTFGFADNPNSKSFADKFDPSISGGIFAEKFIL